MLQVLGLKIRDKIRAFNVLYKSRAQVNHYNNVFSPKYVTFHEMT